MDGAVTAVICEPVYDLSGGNFGSLLLVSAQSDTDGLVQRTTHDFVKLLEDDLLVFRRAA